MKVSQYFSTKEFQCKCHYSDCPKDRAVDIIQVQRLEALRSFVNEKYSQTKGEWAILIVSGWRCKKHNRDVGGKSHSKHLVGIAGDIQIVNFKTREALNPKIIFKILDDMFPHEAGIGLYNDFVHFDRRKRKTRWTQEK